MEPPPASRTDPAGRESATACVVKAAEATATSTTQPAVAKRVMAAGDQEGTQRAARRTSESVGRRVEAMATEMTPPPPGIACGAAPASVRPTAPVRTAEMTGAPVPEPAGRRPKGMELDDVSGPRRGATVRGGGVADGVCEGEGDDVGATERVTVAVADVVCDGEGENDADADCEPVEESVCDAVSVTAWLGVPVAVAEGVPVWDGDALLLAVPLSLGDSVEERLALGVCVALGEPAWLGDRVEVRLGVAVAAWDGEALRVTLGVGDVESAADAVWLGEGEGDCEGEAA
jgi:hypothetical protein